MQELGFWRKSDDDAEDLRPHPASLQDREWHGRNADVAAKVIWYLRHAGCVESYEMGYSFCRIDPSCPSKELGACTMTDGVYCWPEGYVHYLEHHDVVPPCEFIDHVVQHIDACAAQPPLPFLRMWDYETNRPIAMPATMQDMVLANTTLTIRHETTCILS